MIKSRRYIMVVIAVLTLLCVTAYSMEKRDQSMNNVIKEAELKEKEKEKISLIRKEYPLGFDKNNTSFKSEEIEVSKDNTLNQMAIGFLDNSESNKIVINIYQDDKLLKQIKKKADEPAFMVPYEITNDKSKFRLEINYVGPISENEKFTSNIAWYVNKGF